MIEKNHNMSCNKMWRKHPCWEIHTLKVYTAAHQMSHTIKWFDSLHFPFSNQWKFSLQGKAWWRGTLGPLFFLECQKEIHHDLYVNGEFSLGNAFCKVLQWGTGRLIRQRKLIHHQSESGSSLVRAVNRALGEWQIPGWHLSPPISTPTDSSATANSQAHAHYL